MDQVTGSLRAHRGQDERLRRFFELSPQVTWTTDPEGRFTELSPRWTEWTGMSRDDTFAYSWTDMVHPEDRDRLVTAWTTALKTGEPLDCEARLRMRDGQHRWIRSRAYPDRDASGAIVQWYGHTEDVHDRAVAELRRRESEARFRQLADAMPQLVWTARPDGTVDYYNARLSEYGGDVALSEAGYEWAPLVHPDDLARTQTAWEQAVATGRPYVCEHRVLRADGRWAWHLSRAYPATDESGAIQQWFGTATDIDAVRTAEDHRELLMRELDHRVKNTLAIVQSLAHQTLRGEQTLAEARTALTGRLAALSGAHGLLTRQNWRSLDLRALLHEALEAFPQERCSLRGPSVRLPPQAAVAMAMAAHELATNAAKYGALSNETGRVSIRWSREDGRLSLTWRETGGPPVVIPSRRGFGSQMLERALALELGGTVRLEFSPEGLVCRVEASLEGLEPAA